MTIFLTQGRFTHQAMSGMMAKPEDRSGAVKQLAKQADARLLAYYFTFGEYDFLAIFDGPDEKKMAASLIAAASTGAVANLKTTVAMTSAEAKQCFAAAGDIAKVYRPPGG